MVAVSSTTPLRYLIAIEQEHLLGRMFEKVFVPVAVHKELTESRAPESVRLRVLSPPAWYEVRAVPERGAASFPVLLHRGEHEAILLAELLHPDFILIGERMGRTIAMGRNLPVSGTLGVLERADRLGFVKDFPQILKRLKSSGFYIAESLEQRLLQRHHSRHEAK